MDSAKLASKLDAAAAAVRTTPLRVFVQVNTSGEPQKGGVEDADAAVALARHIATACPHLRLAGLMTVGALAGTAAGVVSCADVEGEKKPWTAGSGRGTERVHALPCVYVRSCCHPPGPAYVHAWACSTLSLERVCLL